MTDDPGLGAITTEDQVALTRAVDLLESRSFAIKIAGMIGSPITSVFAMMPKMISRRIHNVVETAMHRCLNVAIDSLDGTAIASPSRSFSKIMSGLTGGLGGVFGAYALPIELPMTTILMLQSIAEIARHHGEDLKRIETRLACIEVFALGERSSKERGDIGYYAARSMLTQLAADVCAVAGQRGAVEAGSPAVLRLVSEYAGRFGLAATERAAASALPIVGAIGGATVNVLFMNHFQQIAEGHFTVRRLERKYGDAVVQRTYRIIARASAA